MMLPSDAKPGDTVEITFRGTLRELLGGVVLTEKGYYNTYLPEFAEVTVVKPEKKQYKVGDVIEGDDYKALPDGTVVLGKYGRVLAKQSGGWRATGDAGRYEASFLRSARRIIHLPS